MSPRVRVRSPNRFKFDSGFYASGDELVIPDSRFNKDMLTLVDIVDVEGNVVSPDVYFGTQAPLQEEEKEQVLPASEDDDELKEDEIVRVEYINIEDMDDETLAQAAEQVGIDPEGMERDDIIAAIEEASEQSTDKITEEEDDQEDEEVNEEVVKPKKKGSSKRRKKKSSKKKKVEVTDENDE